MFTLKDAKIGEKVIVKKLNGEGVLYQHFLDMGVIPGTEMMVVKYAPMGDPIELMLHGYKLTLRLADAEKIEVLGKCKNVLPFEINSEKIDISNVKEDLRLQYRYLDLRNDKIHNSILLRSKIMKSLRREMDELGFTEIQTPILANSSPEGARDYLVPSRLHAGKFYALPQAPQQFKQLLMVSGFDKYYQIAPCFRDEDPRADRAPGEFYQLDMEMSFATQEDVFKVIECYSKSF